MLQQLLYVSVETHPLSDDDLAGLLKQSRHNNERLGITGILIYYKRHFFQVLEGEKEKVFELFNKIKTDQRHISVILVWDQEVSERSFKDWTMAFLNLNEIDKSQLEGFSDFLEKNFTTEITKQHLTIAEQLLVKFKDSLTGVKK